MLRNNSSQMLEILQKKTIVFEKYKFFGKIKKNMTKQTVFWRNKYRFGEVRSFLV